MIHVQDLNFSYRKKSSLLFENFNLDIQPGTICGILGKNGAGKTSLLRLISGLLFPHKGIVSVHGSQSKHRMVDMLSDLYYVQEDYILPDIHIDHYVDLHAPFYTRWDGGKFNDIRIDFELPENKKIKELSFGQKKKFIIAFALATNSRLLILDEPTNGLDIPSKTVFRKVVSSSLSEDQCILISTHQVNDVANLLDRIVIIEGGRVIFNHDLYHISSHFRFDFHPGNIKSNNYLYAEKVPGGYMVISKNDGSTADSEVNIEILFNAVISNSI